MKKLFVKSKFQSIPKGILSGIMLVLILGCIFNSALAAEVQLTWNANTETDLAGYRIYKGLQSGSYTSNVSAGKVTTATMTGLEAGKTYYFAATAYNTSNQESGYSNEIVYQVAAPAPSTWTITASASGNGTISPSGTSTVSQGASLTYTISAGSNYKVSDVVVDGVSQGSKTSYTFTGVLTNHTIQAVFTPVTWTITAATTGNGTISPSGSIKVNQGTDITFTMTADSGYRVSDVIVDGISQGEAVSMTFRNVTSNHGIVVNFITDNQAPLADAGPDQAVYEKDSVMLSGQNSLDPNGDQLDFMWLQLEGPSVELSDSESSAPVFQAPFVSFDGASLVFQLTVRDSQGLESIDTCIVNVTWVNDPPVADAGSYQTVYEGSMVNLDASLSEDSDDGIASYLWTQISGLPVTLSDTASNLPSFIAPDVTMDGTALMFQLTVTDLGGLKSQDTCIINVSWMNEAPVADAGTDQMVGSGELVSLDSRNSSDSDDGIASFHWNQISGLPVTLSDPTNMAPTFMAPDVSGTTALEFQLTVTDSGGLQSSDRCVITIDSSEVEHDVVQYSLEKGWNVIRMTETPVNVEIAAALESIKGKYSNVWLFENGEWLIYFPNYSSSKNTLHVIEDGKQYWIYMRTKAVLEIPIY